MAEEIHKDEPLETIQETQPQGASQGEEPAPLYIGKPQKYHRGKKKWAKRCMECPLHYIHDEQTWCSSKKCPKHCPPALRPKYRPEDIVKSTEEKPVPPKPDITGKSITERNKVLHDYYEINAPFILSDLDKLGKTAMLKKWGISYAGWYNMRYRWRPRQFPSPKKITAAPPGSKLLKKAKEALPAPYAVPQTIEEAEEVCDNCPVVNAYRGYRLAVKDILTSIRR